MLTVALPGAAAAIRAEQPDATRTADARIAAGRVFSQQFGAELNAAVERAIAEKGPASATVSRTASFGGRAGLLSLLFMLFGLSAAPAPGAQPLSVFVSILPEKYFVERVGGEHVSASVMVQPGRSPATYEATPRQMTQLAGATLYLRIGVPFEEVWMERIHAANPRMRIVSLQEGMDLRNIDRVDGGSTPSGAKDPHVWTDPRRVEAMAPRIRDALIEQDPGHRAAYVANCERFIADLQELDGEIRDRLRGLEGSSFMVFHAAWGYFADAYHLREIPIEAGGKEPGARSLQHIIEVGRREKVRVIFVQEQFSTRMAETVAHALDARVVKVDPLAEDYIRNLRRVADLFAQALGSP